MSGAFTRAVSARTGEVCPPPDREADVCDCPLCRQRSALDGVIAPFARGAVPRGPVQDESGALDPLDARAMAEVEGRA